MQLGESFGLEYIVWVRATEPGDEFELRDIIPVWSY